MSILDMALEKLGFERKKSLAELREMALKDFRGQLTNKDLSAFEQALSKSGSDISDFKKLVNTFARREELRKRAAGIEQLEAKAIKLAQAHQFYFDETTKVINDRSQRLVEMKNEAHAATVALENAQEAFRELQRFDFENRELFALDIRLDEVTPTYNGAPLQGRADAPKVEVTWLAYMNESYRRHEMFKAEAKARADRWSQAFKRWQAEKADYEERYYPEVYKTPSPPEPDTPKWEELLPPASKETLAMIKQGDK